MSSIDRLLTVNEAAELLRVGVYEALEGEGGVKAPHVILRHLTAYWNYHEKRLPDWPRLRFWTPFAANRYLLSLSDLSPSLQKEIARWQQRRAGGGLLSLDKIAHKSRPETIQHQTQHVLQFLGLLVREGLVDLKSLKHLEVSPIGKLLGFVARLGIADSEFGECHDGIAFSLRRQIPAKLAAAPVLKRTCLNGSTLYSFDCSEKFEPSRTHENNGEQ